MTPNDDLAGAQKPFITVAVIPVHERIELLPFTIRRLYLKNKVDRVICVGDGLKEKAVCIESGAIWVPHQNKPLGAKWNAGFLAAKTLNPDAVIYSGSSDWLSDNWIPTMKPYLEKHQLVGVPGSYLLDYKGNSMRICHWPGYVGERSDETIGVGRVLSRKLLDLIGWKPFDDTKDNSLDRSMKEKSKAVGFKDYFVIDPSLKALSISTDRWINKHKFIHHEVGPLPSEMYTQIEMEQFLVRYFPEAYQLFK